MGLTFTSDARPPSNTQLLPNRFLRPAFGELYGFDADADSGVTIDGALLTEANEFLMTEDNSNLLFDADVFSNVNSVTLDGVDDYIDCGGNTDFSFTDGAGNDDPFSVSTWVKLDSTFKQRIVAKGNVEWILTTDSSDKLFFSLYGGGSTSTRIGLVSDSVVLSAGTWHHIVATYDGSNADSGLTMYVDGSVVTASTSSAGSYTGMSSGQGALRIGQWELNSQVMDGLIDETSVFDSELSSSQVTTIYNSGVPNDIISLNPLGFWRMGDNDGATGTTITDQGSGGNDGTLTNGPTFSTTVPS